jgi:hypothetical protein
MAITAATAKTVRERDRVCRLCGLGEFEPTRGFGWRMVLHHVLPKGLGGTAVVDRDHPDKLVLLHDECHREVHANPREARALGLIQSRLGQVRPSALIGPGSADRKEATTPTT